MVNIFSQGMKFSFCFSTLHIESSGQPTIFKDKIIKQGGRSNFKNISKGQSHTNEYLGIGKKER